MNRPLEKGLVCRTRYTRVDRLRAELNDCVYWFNNQRLHSMFG
ncbi:IS3 family transposase [Bifidobacterium longum subsp. infantis]|uniref:IS3 family transposase n=1 Tax=Bifidobacterium longum subsp. infantis TaxID=1682 RepID=A0A7D5BRN1_BIFLI|nr:IS3 family transposase [Bifidobacterium longum subsp. infantis]NQX50062.1 IS3 family transposase [Bifidobacterium longum subsp. infantis]QKY13013.1 IS3 family transposase [Bifidobacterium longum subsp. infantis]UPT03132.1 IS3 family transposase [Bifidobacterium longum subsp. infantis]UPT05579.1 IS3 family transposase [Bifidobacterium longum subsp. infantis]